mmetsp:Transcript_107060/g.302752  ORF Transcript_107060/g.302752 Transcript_107060/m.302752 type:complete len:253 (+) Transcript_107060:164-922(+)
MRPSRRRCPPCRSAISTRSRLRRCWSASAPWLETRASVPSTWASSRLAHGGWAASWTLPSRRDRSMRLPMRQPFSQPSSTRSCFLTSTSSASQRACRPRAPRRSWLAWQQTAPSWARASSSSCTSALRRLSCVALWRRMPCSCTLGRSRSTPLPLPWPSRTACGPSTSQQMLPQKPRQAPWPQSRAATARETASSGSTAARPERASSRSGPGRVRQQRLRWPPWPGWRAAARAPSGCPRGASTWSWGSRVSS